MSINCQLLSIINKVFLKKNTLHKKKNFYKLKKRMDRIPVRSLEPIDLIKDKLLQPQANNLAPYLVAKALLDIPCKIS